MSGSRMAIGASAILVSVKDKQTPLFECIYAHASTDVNVGERVYGFLLAVADVGCPRYEKEYPRVAGRVSTRAAAGAQENNFREDITTFLRRLAWLACGLVNLKCRGTCLVPTVSIVPSFRANFPSHKQEKGLSLRDAP